MDAKGAFGILAIAATIVSVSPQIRSQTLGLHLHKNAYLDPGPSPESVEHSLHKPISSLQAATYGLNYLNRRGVRDVVICEVNWIAAPLGGYLVDAKGKGEINGSSYSIFRVGVRDGSDEREGTAVAGEVFVFLAFGKDASGKAHWYPSPGPDYSGEMGPAETEAMLAYEFLLHRERFETLDERYP